MTFDFMSFLTVFQSYQGNGWMIMKGCVQWNPVAVERHISLKALTSPYFQLRDKFKCIEHVDKSET